jgi:putative ABC transport system permease protein
MSYTLTILWDQRRRYLPAVAATAFSALVVAVQGGLLLGMFAFASLPVDHTRADVWVGGRGVGTVDRGYAIPDRYLCRLAAQPEVERCEVFIQGFAYWHKPGGGVELAMVVGSRLDVDALGAVAELTPALRRRLTEPGAVVLDESDLGLLGVRGVGDTARISGQPVRVVGLVRGLRGMAGAYVFCSVPTARRLLGLGPGETIYLLGRCRDGADAAAVAARLAGQPGLTACTSADFSARSRLHWLTKTRAGVALGCVAVVALLVGAAVTSQTLEAAVAASLREYTVLWALGIPRRRMAAAVAGQAFWVGALGVAVALPPAFASAAAADRLGLSVLLPPWLLAATALTTLASAMLSGLHALRLLWRLEPHLLLRQ